jgi:peroxiredoxin
MDPASPDTIVGSSVPDLALPATTGGMFGLRSRVGVGPLVLFFYIRNGTPG